MSGEDNTAPNNFTSEDISEDLKAVFGETLDLNDPTSREDFSAALCNLSVVFLESVGLPPSQHKPRFDAVAINMLISRFARDAYGVRSFHLMINDLVADGGVSSNAATRIKNALSKIGIRINTDAPRKTKIAAAFTLWMCTFRPVSFASCQFASGTTREKVERLHAIFTFWLCSSYLSLFGNVIIDELPDAGTRTERIYYDFTFRGINLSSLEMLYCSLFKPN